MTMHVRTRFLVLGGIAAAGAVLVAGAGLVPARAGKVPPSLTPADVPACSSGKACFGYANTLGGPGLRGESRFGNGVVGITTADQSGFGEGASGVLGRDFSVYGLANAGVSGISVVGNGVFGFSIEGSGLSGRGNPGVRGVGYQTGTGYWPGVVAIGGYRHSTCVPNGPCPPAFVTESNYAKDSGVVLFAATDNAANLVASLDDSGNLHLSGQVFTGGS